MKAPLAIRLSDSDAERVRQSHAQLLQEIQARPAVNMEVIRDVPLNGTSASVVTVVPHRLGRAPVYVGISALRVAQGAFGSLTAGAVVDHGAKNLSTNEPIDRTKVVVLGAFGYGVAITVDVQVM